MRIVLVQNGILQGDQDFFWWMRYAYPPYDRFPTHRRVKARRVVQASRRLGGRFAAWQRGEISFAEFDASVQGWINHVRHADTWGLRRHLLEPFVF